VLLKDEMEYKTKKELEEKYRLLKYQDKPETDYGRGSDPHFRVLSKLYSLLPEWLSILRDHFRKVYDPGKTMPRDKKVRNNGYYYLSHFDGYSA